MRKYLFSVIVFCLAQTVLGADRPNILFCLADDWGWPHAGAYGDPVVKTPAFDRLADEGVLFENAFVSVPSCTPCRNAILTGQQFYRLGRGANLHSTLDIKHPNFVFLLREAGYEVGHHRKAWGPGRYNVGGYEEHPCGPGLPFKQFLEQRDPDKSFCYWLGTSDPHRGYDEGRGRTSGMDINAVPVPDFWPDVEAIRSDIADYYWEVQRWDGDVAQALSLLEKAGDLENTIIVMTGDHGMPFPRCKANLYDWGSRVPLAIRWGANVEGGRTVTDFVSFTDFAPTFLDAAGVDIPDAMTGRSLLPLLMSESEGRVSPNRGFIVYGRERHTPAQEEMESGGYPARAIRTDDFLYIRNYEPNRWPAGTPDWRQAYKDRGWLGDCDNGPTKFYLAANRDVDAAHRRFYDLSFAKRPAEELYVLADDPDQINNVADHPDYAEQKKRLATRLTDYLRDTGDPRHTDQPVKFDDYPYYGGIPGWPGEEALKQYKR